MPQFKRACRLCGKQVSSVSGLTRHTEVCRKRKALREIENTDRRIQLEPYYSVRGNLSVDATKAPKKKKRETLEFCEKFDDANTLAYFIIRDLRIL